MHVLGGHPLRCGWLFSLWCSVSPTENRPWNYCRLRFVTTRQQEDLLCSAFNPRRPLLHDQGSRCPLPALYEEGEEEEEEEENMMVKKNIPVLLVRTYRDTHTSYITYFTCHAAWCTTHGCCVCVNKVRGGRTNERKNGLVWTHHAILSNCHNDTYNCCVFN